MGPGDSGWEREGGCLGRQEFDWKMLWLLRDVSLNIFLGPQPSFLSGFYKELHKCEKGIPVRA